MKKLILTGLALLLVGCSTGKQSVSITPQSTINLFGGIEEEYKPTIIRNEQTTDHGLVSTYFGVSSDEYTIPAVEVCEEAQGMKRCATIKEEEKAYLPSLIMGIDLGFRSNYDNFYHGGRLGLAYISRKFDNHEFQNNFHFGYGIGFDNDNFGLGIELNHWSAGNKIFKWNKDKRNSGVTTIGGVLELKF